MLANQATNLSKWDEKLKASAEEEYESFRNVLEWTEDFGLVFVQCAPVQGEELIKKVTKDLLTKKVGVLSFQSGEEIRNLYDLVDQMPNRDQLDILFIKGLEYSFIPYIKSGYGGQGDYYKLDNLPPILSHLNLQRERFRTSFNICFVFLLPLFGIKYFIQRAPDFFDWRSGIYEFSLDQNTLDYEITRLLYRSKLYRDNPLEKYKLLTPRPKEELLSEIQDYLTASPQPPSKQVFELLLEKGIIHFESQEYQEANICFDQALDIRFDKNLDSVPNYYEAWYTKGSALGLMGRYEESISAYDQALQDKPDLYKAWNNRGISLEKSGRYKEAIISFDNALKIEPNFDEAWQNKGISLLYLNKLEEGISAYLKAVKIQPDKVNLDGLKNIISNKNKYLTAFSDYQDIHEQASLLIKSNNNKQAILLCEKALIINPDFYETWYSRGIALENLGRYEEAISSYKKSIEINPNFYLALVHLGKVLSNFGKIEIAMGVAYFDKALKIKPDFYEAWYNRGVAFKKLGKFDEAIASCNEALKIRVDDADVYFTKARAYSLKGNIPLAFDSLRRAIALNSKHLEIVKTDTDFDKIRNDRRFIDLLNQKRSPVGI